MYMYRPYRYKYIYINMYTYVHIYMDICIHMYPSADSKQKFTTYRNKFKSIRINAERNYYATEFCKHHNDLKMTWKLIRSAMHLDIKHPKIHHLLINGAKIDNADKIAYSFNNYFINIANDLTNGLQDPPCHFDDYLPPSNLNSMGLTLTTPKGTHEYREEL